MTDDSGHYSGDTERLGHCVLCAPAPHPPCEEYTSVWIEDPSIGLEGEVRVCLGHYEAIEKCLKALERRGED